MAESLVVSYRSRAPVGLPRRSLHQNYCHSLPLPKPLLSLTLQSPLSLKYNSVATSLHRRVISCPAPASLDSDVPHTLHEGSVKHGSNKSFEQWDSLTAKFSGAASIPFLLLQLPQIILNASNLLAGNKTALLAVPWLIMWSTFVPYIPNSIFPGAVAFVIAMAAVIMARTGKLSEKGVKFVGAISGWTATLLFMWMPVAQMWTNFLNPDNIKGLSTFSMLLAMMGNGLMIPRALFMRDFMWFLGSTWASLFYGYGNILCLYCFNAISRECFFAATTGLFLWIGMTLWKDTVVYGYGSPFTSLKELVFGS
ncbi:hypothetical protein I3760_06G035700 [Carya illinoinensis]|nr:hypothetical protein I3760_06G035700 [Carya illinoinensis]